MIVQDQNEVHVIYESRPHEKSPFGVVESQMKVELHRENGVLEKFDVTLKLTDIGETALTELPGQQ